MHDSQKSGRDKDTFPWFCPCYFLHVYNFADSPFYFHYFYIMAV